MSGIGALVKATKAARKAEPFYSAVDEAAQALTRGKGTGKEFMIEVLKKPGVKPTEIKERGLQKIEAMPKMTKEEFLNELEKRPAPQVEEKVLREPTESEIYDRAHEMAYDDAMEELRADGMNRHEAEDIAAEMAEDRASMYMNAAAENISESGGEAPYHGNYTIPGGQNYREILLKTPGFKGDKKIMELEAMRRRVDPELHSHRYNDLTKQIDTLKAEKAAMPEQFKGVDAHFGGEPGILASIRVSDRTGPKGEKVLHVEEIQSDWHQQGRKRGYKGSESVQDIEAQAKDDFNKFYGGKGNMSDEEWSALNNRVEDWHKKINQAASGVPDAPFKKNWHELAMKRMLNYAAENGYDKVAITPGAEQANRYNLANHVNQVEVYKLDDGRYNLEVIDKNGKSVSIPDSRAVTPDRISEIVGKDVAEKAVKQADQAGQSILGGLDLEVGGEGMKGFYDKMLPDYLNSYGKKYGVQVNPMDIITHPEVSTPQIAAPGIGHFPEPIVEPAKTQQVHGFEITPQMREEITGKGLPLYQQIGIPAGGAAAGAGALEQDEQGFADGGVVRAATGGEFDTDPDMADGGLRVQGTAFKKGGQVHLSQNPDTMLLDLMSRS